MTNLKASFKYKVDQPQSDSSPGMKLTFELRRSEVSASDCALHWRLVHGAMTDEGSIPDSDGTDETLTLAQVELGALKVEVNWKWPLSKDESLTKYTPAVHAVVMRGQGRELVAPIVFTDKDAAARAAKALKTAATLCGAH